MSADITLNVSKGVVATAPPAVVGNVVTTVAGLRASTSIPVTATVVTTDFGGGLWYYAGVYDGDVEDNTGSIIVTANNRVWKRIGHPTAASFGVKGDGTDETAVLQKAIDNIDGVVVLEGEISVTNFINVRSNQTLRGMGKSKTIIKMKDNGAENGNTNGNFVIKVRGKHNVAIENLTIDANGANQNVLVNQTSCLELSGTSTNIRIQDVKFNDARTGPGYSGGYGIVAWAGNGGTGEGGADIVYISDCEFEKCGQSDIGLFDGQDWVVSNCVSRDTGYVCINVESELNSRFIKRVVVNGWTASNVGRALITSIRNVNTGPVTDITITNCTVDGVSLVNDDIGAIRIRGTERTTIQNINIRNCRGTGARLSVDSQFPIIDAVLDNINMQGMGLYGLWAEGDTSNQIQNLYLNNISVKDSVSLAFNISYCNDLVLSNPRIDNSDGGAGIVLKNITSASLVNGFLVSPSTYGVQFRDSKNVSVTGLKIKNAGYAGFYLTGATDNIAINSCVVKDDRLLKLSQFGVFVSNDDFTTVTPALSLIGNDFSENASIPIFIHSSINQTKVKRLLNHGDAIQALNTREDQSIEGVKTFVGDGSSPLVVVQSTGPSGGSLNFVNTSNPTGFRFGLTGSTSGDLFIYNATSGGISLAIEKVTDNAIFGGRVSGVAGTGADDFVTKGQLDTALAITSPDATAGDTASIVALLNEIKAKLNAL